MVMAELTGLISESSPRILTLVQTPPQELSHVAKLNWYIEQVYNEELKKNIVFNDGYNAFYVDPNTGKHISFVDRSMRLSPDITFNMVDTSKQVFQSKINEIQRKHPESVA